MKKIILLLAGFVITTSAFSQSANKMDSWAELNSFHKVMSETYHPSEDGNLKPIKERSEELLQASVALHKSNPPAGIDKKIMEDATTRLAYGCKELMGLISLQASDEEITKKLASVHDTFHQIAGLCEKSGTKPNQSLDHSDPNHKH
jgi:hypothetical protein